MNELNGIVELIESVDTVPSTNALPSGALSSAELLALIDERNKNMTDTKTRRQAGQQPTDRLGSRRRYRGPLVALASAAVLAVVFIVTTNLGPGGDGSVTAPPVVAPPVAERAARALPADTPLLDVVATFMDRFDSGDISGYEALFHPDTGYVSGSDAEASWFGAVTGIQHDRSCESVTETQVQCVEQATSGLEPGTVTDEFTTLWNGADGYILSIEFPDGAPVEFSDPINAPGVAAYREWLRRINPDEFAALFTDEGAMKLDTNEARSGHREFVPFFLSSTGPRAEGALPADTPLLEVVSTFVERFDAGDVAGYEAIFHPMAGYPSGQDAETSWFGAVTGMQHERDCQVISETEVQCSEVAISGLEPGTRSEEITSVWAGADGYIWSIEFPDGPPRDFTDPSSGPGVAAYREWLEINAPDVVGELFLDDARLALDTEEARAAQRELVARFLADISN
jgi:ketosteroid isomerase-like protein